MGKPRIVIVGAGFGGLEAAKRLRGAGAHVVVVDRQNHHLFQPLLYQVATAGLSPADIAVPIRGILRGTRNVEVVLADVVGVDAQAKKVVFGDGDAIPYDQLILATGARHGYFGQESWELHAPGLKTVDEAICIRRNILLAFEMAERARDERQRSAAMTFVLIGAGATGVEMAGSIAELASRVLVRDFDHIRPEAARVVLIEAGDRVLSGFDPGLSERARQDLKGLGVEVKLNTRVTGVDERGVETSEGRIDARTVIWAAGVQASPAAIWLGLESDRAGRIPVSGELEVPGLQGVFAIGDCARYEVDGEPLPLVAPVAMQQGRHVARVVRARLEGKRSPGPFRYRDKGMLATIGRRAAVAQFRGTRIAGTLAWLIWLFVHVLYLIGFRNKFVVFFHWAYAYLTWQSGARLITRCSE
jgi:NADH:ubiquinone reductase (H+-translocating)